MTATDALMGQVEASEQARGEWQKQYEEMYVLAMQTARRYADLRNALMSRLGMIGSVPDDQLADAIAAKVADATDAARKARTDLRRHECIHGHPAVMEAIVNVRQAMGNPESDELPGDIAALDAFLVYHEATTD